MKEGAPRSHFEKSSMTLLFPGLRWVSDIFLCSICLNPYALGDPEGWHPIAGLGSKWLSSRVPLLRLTTEGTKITLIQDLKEHPRAETRRPITTADERSCMWETDHVVRSDSESKERHNPYRKDSGLSRRGRYNTMNSLGHLSHASVGIG